MKTTLGTLLTIGMLALAGCSSDNDDDGGSSSMNGGGTPVDTAAPSGDVLDILARGDMDDAATLDRATLQQSLDTFGGETDEPLSVEDDDTASTVLNRGR